MESELQPIQSVTSGTMQSQDQISDAIEEPTADAGLAQDAGALAPDSNAAVPFQSPLLAGQRIAFVGRLGGMNRKEARKLVRAGGGTMSDKVDPSIDVIVIGAEELPLDEENHPLLEDWVVAAAAEGTLRVISETRFWQEMGMVEADSDVYQLYTPAALAQLLDVPVTTIRRWYRRGLIQPVRKVLKLAYFDFQEVASARRIAKLIADGASPQSVERKLTRLAELYPELQRPLSQLSVLVEGHTVLLRQGSGLIEPGGQRRFDFDEVGDAGAEASGGNEAAEAEKVYSFASAQEESEALIAKSVDELTTPEEFLRLAVSLEDAGEVDSAIEVYRAQGLAFGPSPDLSFRLAELLYQQGDLAAARERYYSAIELDESLVEARASLGCVLVELGQNELAISAFHGALEHHDDYPDVHFHLAKLLDSMGRTESARLHWTRFLDLAPQSPWADEAREHLESTADHR